MTNMDALKDLLNVKQLAGQNLLRKARAIVTGLPMLAQAFVEESGRKIRIARITGRAELGVTDGRTIWLTDTPLPRDHKDVDRFLLLVAVKVGLLHHEIGHVNETDFAMKRPVKEPIVNNCLGIIEDIRQENARIRKVKSARRYLDALGVAMHELGHDGPVPADAPTIRVFTAFLLYYLRAEFRGEAIYAPLADQAGRILEDRFTAGFRTRLEAVLEEMVDLRSTTDSLRLSRQVARFLQDEADAAAQQSAQQQAQNNAQSAGNGGQQSPGANQSQQGQGGSNGQQGSGGPDTDDAGNNGQSNGGAQQQQQQQQGSGDTDTDDTGNNSQSDDGDTQQQPQDNAASADGSDQLTPDQLKSLQQALDDLLSGKDADQAIGDRDAGVRQALGHLQQEMNQVSHDTAEVDMESIEAASRDITSRVVTGAPHDLDATVSATTRLKSRLRQVLQAQSITRTGRSDRGNKIDGKVVHRLALSDARVFKTVQPGVTADTSVFLLIDVSGSMQGTKIALASQAMFAAAVAMQAMPGVEVACGAFPGRQVILPFGARPQRERDRFHLSSHGFTPMHEGVVMAHLALKHRRKPRKLLVVLTDGEPDCMTTAEATLDNVREDGIEVFAIGIETDYVQHLFPDRWAAVNDINELPESLMSVLRGRLLRAAA